MLGAVLLLGGCVMQSKYNAMLQQQQALEASLRAEIDADQVKIEQLENGIRVRMSDDLLYSRGRRTISTRRTHRARQIVGQLAKMAAQNNEIDVVGNTDDVPVGAKLAYTYPTNWELAGARATVVVRLLQAAGSRSVAAPGNLDRPVPSGRVKRYPAGTGAEPAHGHTAAPDELRTTPASPVRSLVSGHQKVR